jgi:adenylate kinase
VDGAKLYQREDDTIETQRRRIEVYFEQTTPLLDYYRDTGLLVEIDGEQPIEDVYRDLTEAIEARR